MKNTLILFVCALLLSCGINHSVQKVLTNETAFNQVGRKWASLNPIDTSITKIVNTTNTVLRVDTMETNYILLDTTTHKDTLYKVKVINRLQTIRDTTIKYIIDNRMLHTQEDSTSFYKNKSLQNIIILQDYQKNLTKFKWLFWILLILVALGLLANFYIKYIATKIKI